MKIAFVSLMKILPWGGSEELWFKTAKLALTNGHAVYSLTQEWDTIPAKIEELKKLGANTRFYYTSGPPSVTDRIAIRMRLKQRLVEVVPAINADVYIISNGSVFDFIYSRQTIKNIIDNGKPYVMISQHNFENGNIVSFAHRDYAIDIVQRAARFYFVAKRNLENTERQLASVIENAAVISNPLNIKDVSITKFPESNKLLMACVARLDCAFKGQDILLQVLSAGAWIGRSYRLKLYGSGPHLEYLHQLIQFYNLSNKVTLEGHVNDVDQIWEANQVLVLPSLSEGTPLALVEAMLSGRAVLSTDVGDNGKYVLSGTTGFLAATASVGCIASALEELWEHRGQLQIMGENAFAHSIKITDLNPDETLLKFIETIG